MTLNNCKIINHYKVSGPLTIINAGTFNNHGTIYNGCAFSKEQEEEQVPVNAETAEVTETRTVKVTRPVDSIESPIVKYMTDLSKAEYTLSWLHSLMDGASSPKDKLLPLRGLVEIGVFKDMIPYKDYVVEFGYMPKTTYSQWMKENSNYKEKELELIVKTYIKE